LYVGFFKSRCSCLFIGLRFPLFFNAAGGGGVRQNTAVLYPIYYADDDMFRPLWAIFRSQTCI